jgi:hypothetical protein
MKIFLLLTLISTSLFAQRTSTIDADCLRIKDGICIDKFELGYLDGLTGNIKAELDLKGDAAWLQNQIDLRAGISGDQTLDGRKTLDGKLSINSTTEASKPCPVMTQAERNAIASPSAILGECVINSTTNAMNIYNGTSWQAAGGGLSAWITAFPYAVNDIVIQSNMIYQCLIAHTSGTFATDLAAVRWLRVSTDVSGATGVLALANGGSDKALTSVLGGVVYTDANSMEVLGVGTSGQYLKSNAGAAPTWSAVDIATSSVTGVLPVANGGTNKNLTVVNGGVLWTDTDSVEVIAAGTNGQILRSNGAAAPTWITSSLTLKTCYANFGGAAATLAAPVVCSTGTCIEMYDSCGTFSPPAFSSTGYYTNSTFAAGTWANSSHINCTAHGYNTTNGNNIQAMTGNSTGEQTVQTSSGGGWINDIQATTLTGTATNGHVQITCTGTAP